MSELTIEDWAGTDFLRAEDVLALKEPFCCITKVIGFKHSAKYDKDNFVVEVELSNKQKRTWTMNKTSARRVLNEKGKDTSTWAGTVLNLQVEKVMVRGESKNVITATPAFKKPEEIKISKSGGGAA
jgi:hypothetical protein